MLTRDYPDLMVKVAADVGGTFTDIALIVDETTIASHKLPSTPPNYEEAIVEGIAELLRQCDILPARVHSVLHGTTVATNAILEGRGAATALLTTAGFRDVLELRRIRVPKLYAPLWRKPPPLVPRNLRYEAHERLDARGTVIVPLDEEGVENAARQMLLMEVEAVAVAFLHAYQNPAHEQQAGKILKSVLPAHCFVTLSSDVLPEIREYERTSTTVINAYVGPTVIRYISALRARLADAGISGRLLVMQSSGGMIDAETVVTHPVSIVECGPAAGVIGAQKLAAASDIGDVITLDMGGTTAKASIVEGGRILRTDEYEIGGGISISNQLVKGGGYALKTPVIDISEVGAGGGSIIWLDKAGQMKVGPQSAGAVPGPACYGRGGVLATLTDANVVLGYLNPKSIAGGSVAIDPTLARTILERTIARPLGIELERAAFGAHVIANATMTRAVKTVTTHRGRDPRNYSMLAFGGNGGINAVELARAMQIGKVVVPPAAGIFSAVGLLVADVAVTHSSAFIRGLTDLDAAEFDTRFTQLEQLLQNRLERPRDDLVFQRQAGLRYVGQAFELVVDLPAVSAGALFEALADAFECEHERSYGHRFPGARKIELVNIRATATLREAQQSSYPTVRREAKRETARQAYFGPAIGYVPTPVLSRQDLYAGTRAGPLIVEEQHCTTVVPPGCHACVDPMGNIEIGLDLQETNP